MPKRLSLKNLIKPWHRLSVRRQGFIVIAVPLLCLILSLGVFSWLRYSIDQSQKWIDHTNEVLMENNQLLTGLLNAETGVRGYVITLRPEFLEPYYMAQSSIPTRLTRLQTLVSDNAQQTVRLQNITQIMQQRVRTLVELVELMNRSDSKSFTQSDTNRLIVQGKTEMDRLRLGLTEFEQQEQSLLKIRRDDLNFQRNFNEILLWAVALVSALGSVFTLILFSRLDRNLSEREHRLLQSKNLIEAIISNVVSRIGLKN